MKRLFNVLVSLVLVASMLAGCGEGQPEQDVATPQSSAIGNAEQPDNEGDKAAEPESVAEVDTPTAEKPMRVEVLDKTFKEIGQWSEGVCPVLDPSTGLWGYVDKTGEYVIQPQYYEALPFSEDLAAVKGATGMYSFIDKSGKSAFAGEFSSVESRYLRSLVGFADGFAAVREKGGGNRKLIDKSGAVSKELDGNGPNIILQTQYANHGEFLLQMNGGQMYDKQYNEICKVDGRPQFSYTNTSSASFLFSDTTKYLVVEGDSGYYVVDATGKTVFEQKQIPGPVDKMGITDDYVIATRRVNDIKTAAVFNLDGSVVFDFQYKEIYPMTKDIFVAVNNAGVCGVIDKTGKELIPFSYNLTSFNRCSMDLLLDRVKRMGGISYIVKSETGDTAHHLDIETLEIVDDIIYKNCNLFEYRYQCEAGTFYDYRDEELLDENAEPLTFDAGRVPFKKGEEGEFFKEGVIPVLREDKTGLTFAIITR